MRLATSTCLFPAHRGGGQTPIPESIALCARAGFRVIDLNFCFASNKNNPSPFCSDEWEKFVEEIGEAGAKYGVTFNQSHAPFDSYVRRADRKWSDEDRAWYFESVRRAIVASGRLGAKWVVTHGQTDILDDEMSFEQNLRTNVEFYSTLLEWAKQNGTGIAVENMAEFDSNKTKHRFTAIVEEQIAVIDAMNDADLKGCWDFGHATLVYRDQTVPLRKLGHRLVATHIQECDGKKDDHFLPFVRGNTPWEKIMPLLKEINYEGDFTYEIHGFTGNVPDALRPSAARFAFEVGTHLVSLYDKA